MALDNTPLLALLTWIRAEFLLFPLSHHCQEIFQLDEILYNVSNLSQNEESIGTIKVVGPYMISVTGVNAIWSLFCFLLFMEPFSNSHRHTPRSVVLDSPIVQRTSSLTFKSTVLWSKIILNNIMSEDTCMDQHPESTQKLNIFLGTFSN